MTSTDLTRRGFASVLAALATLPAARVRGQALGKLGSNFDEILAGAKLEGKLTAWIVAPRLPATHSALIAAFNKRFGLDTKLEWVPNPPVTSTSRALAELAGGAVSVDVIGGSAIEDLAVATNAKLISRYSWSTILGAALPALSDLEGRVIPALRGDALPYQTVAYGICWNPNSIADGDVPDKFVDLGDPKYKSRFAFNSFLSPMEILSYLIGNPATIELMRKILANTPVFVRGTPAAASAVANGEVPFGVTVSPVAETMQRAKSPLKFKLFSDFIPLSQIYVYVPDAAPHPNTARLFAAWLATEGSAIGEPLEPMARVGDADSMLGRMMAEDQAKFGAKIAEARTVEDVQESATLRETLLNMLNGQSQ